MYVRCCLPVPAYNQSDYCRRLSGISRRSAHSQQDHWSSLCRYEFNDNNITIL